MSNTSVEKDKAVIRVFFTDGTFKCFLVTESQTVNAVKFMVSKKLALDPKELHLFGMYVLEDDSKITELDVRPFELHVKWGSKSGEKYKFLFKRADEGMSGSAAPAGATATVAAPSTMGTSGPVSPRSGAPAKVGLYNSGPVSIPSSDVQQSSRPLYSSAGSAPNRPPPTPASPPSASSPLPRPMSQLPSIPPQAGDDQQAQQQQPAFSYSASPISTRSQPALPPSPAQRHQPQQTVIPPQRSGFVPSELANQQQKPADTIGKQQVINWVNSVIRPSGRSITNLASDLEDGAVLFTLLELLTNKKFKGWHQAPSNLMFKLDNLSLFLKTMNYFGFKITGVSPEDIFGGNENITLALLLVLLKHFGDSHHRQSVSAGSAAAQPPASRPALPTRPPQPSTMLPSPIKAPAPNPSQQQAPLQQIEAPAQPQAPQQPTQPLRNSGGPAPGAARPLPSPGAQKLPMASPGAGRPPSGQQGGAASPSAVKRPLPAPSAAPNKFPAPMPPKKQPPVSLGQPQPQRQMYDPSQEQSYDAKPATAATTTPAQTAASPVVSSPSIPINQAPRPIQASPAPAQSPLGASPVANLKVQQDLGASRRRAGVVSGKVDAASVAHLQDAYQQQQQQLPQQQPAAAAASPVANTTVTPAAASAAPESQIAGSQYSGYDTSATHGTWDAQQQAAAGWYTPEQQQQYWLQQQQWQQQQQQQQWQQDPQYAQYYAQQQQQQSAWPNSSDQFYYEDSYAAAPEEVDLATTSDSPNASAFAAPAVVELDFSVAVPGSREEMNRRARASTLIRNIDTNVFALEAFSDMEKILADLASGL